MQADVEQLRRHQRDVENRELELMEAREPLDADLVELDAPSRALVGRARRASARRSATPRARSTAEMRRASARHATRSRPSIDAALRRRLRAVPGQRNGASGVARLVGTTCQGCHLSIPADRGRSSIKKAPRRPISHCDNCGAILVP